MQILLDGGADTEIQDKEGQTALFMAAGNVNPEAVSLLLRHGANRFHRDHANRSAVDRARASGIAFAGQGTYCLDWSPERKAAREAASEAALAVRVAKVIALLEDTKAAE